jgi:DNA (cytosine-5)-methyltransferase 1
MLSLFSGIGGIDLAAQWAAIETVAFCESEPFCQKVLRKNFGQDIVIFDDVRTLTAESLRARGIDPESISLVGGGFPCQDVSEAGQGAGIEGERSGLWRHMSRIIGEIAPTWVLVENVRGLRTRGIDRVISDLEGEGYTVAPPCVVGAWSVGAPHRRSRVFIVAYAGRRSSDSGAERTGWETWADFGGSGTRAAMADADGSERRAPAEGRNDLDRSDAGREEAASGLVVCGEALAHASREQFDRGVHPRRGWDGFANLRWHARPGEAQHEWEAPRLIESGMGNSVDGLPRWVAGRGRVAKLKALGNSVVPAQVYPILKAIADYEFQA